MFLTWTLLPHVWDLCVESILEAQPPESGLLGGWLKEPCASSRKKERSATPSAAAVFTMDHRRSEK